MALIPHHGFSNGTVDEAIHAFALNFCVRLNLGFAAFFNPNFYFIIVVFHIFAYCFLLSF